MLRSLAYAEGRPAPDWITDPDGWEEFVNRTSMRSGSPTAVKVRVFRLQELRL